MLALAAASPILGVPPRPERDTAATALGTSHSAQPGPVGLAAHAKSIDKSCGYFSSKKDCPLDYDLEALNASARASADSAETLAAAHERARLACGDDHASRVQSSGGWCYDKHRSELIRAGNNSNADFLLPEFHVPPDPIVVRVLSEQYEKSPFTMADFGAGVGQLGRALKYRFPGMKYSGYDAGGNVEEITNGFVKFADLTIDLDLPKVDWVYTSEVGEHVPHNLESTFIRNIHATNCRGVILSWAVPGQGGHSHINCHSSEYLIDLFTQLGYRVNWGMRNRLRATDEESFQVRGDNDHGGGAWWLHKSFLVFERITPPEGCSTR